ncbi:MAG: Glycosyltransferase [Candidatus Frackibacter sp. T328-2]|jgi:glycosyltransferase involved in cell wall biosynthesis|nr:MAG: Glycosyltransferase [Candidatus Frackibacter sp. T328-2]
MKILHVINNLGSGGAEKLIEDTLPVMNQYNDIKIELLILTKKNNVFDEKLKSVGINIYNLETNIYNPINIFRIRQLLKKNDYDLIHVHLFPTFYWVTIANMLNFRNKIPLVMTEHSTYNRRRKYKFFKIFDKLIYNQIDKIISISKDTQLNLKKWLDTNKDDNKFEIINNGINTEKFKNAEPYKKDDLLNPYSSGNILITMVGRFSEHKDQKTLIRAIKNLPNKFHLILIGEGNLKSDCENLVQNLKINDRVHFLGFRKDVERIMKTSDIIVLSSNWEGFGLVAVEGMAAGKPVIASDVNGLKEIVNGFGLLFEQGNEKELSFLINKLISDQDFYKEISNKCYNRAKDYSIRKMTNSLIKVYEKLSIQKY